MTEVGGREWTSGQCDGGFPFGIPSQVARPVSDLIFLKILVEKRGKLNCYPCVKRCAVTLGSCLLVLSSQVDVNATQVFASRQDWLVAINGPHWDVNLEDGTNNNLHENDVLVAGSSIQLPPDFDQALSFDSDLTVRRGAGWNNYIDPAGGDPLVLATLASQLAGTFSDYGQTKFGFELLTSADLWISLTLSDYVTIESFQVSAKDGPQFFGWITDDSTAVKSFTISGIQGELLIGNFVVPDTGATIWLLGLGMLCVAGARLRFA